MVSLASYLINVAEALGNEPTQSPRGVYHSTYAFATVLYVATILQPLACNMPATGLQLACNGSGNCNCIVITLYCVFSLVAMIVECTHCNIHIR